MRRVICLWILATACGGQAPTGDGDGGVAPDAGLASLPVTCSGRHPDFAADVEPIFHQCAGIEGCHGFAPNPSTWLVNKPAACGPWLLVKPSDPSHSYLLAKLTNTEICTGVPMPKRFDKWQELPADQLQTLVDWVCDGAPSQ